jgi:hypothetical protein
MKHWLFLIAVTIALLLVVACNRGPARDLNEGSSLDHVSQGPHLAPQRVTHGLVKLSQGNKFAFDVPPHAMTPRLAGTFSSFVQGAGGARVNDESADVELMVMTDDQYDAYINHRSAESLYAIDPSHDSGVSIALPATQETGAHYYAVFRRNSDAKAPVWVNADLSVVFEVSR